MARYHLLLALVRRFHQVTGSLKSLLSQVKHLLCLADRQLGEALVGCIAGVAVVGYVVTLGGIDPEGGAIAAVEDAGEHEPWLENVESSELGMVKLIMSSDCSVDAMVAVAMEAYDAS